MADGKWVREGLVLGPPDKHSWWTSHAQAPTILPLEQDLWRIYFAARDSSPKSRIMCADFDIGDGLRLVKLHADPVLEPGKPGVFDCHGVGPATAIKVGREIHLYYTGIIRRTDVPYALGIGLAVSEDGLNFSRRFEGPVLATGPFDPFFASTPYVGPFGSGFEMLYASGLGWSHRPEERGEPLYDIRRTESPDGLIWSLATQRLVGGGTPEEGGVVRPWLIADDPGRRLWYCIRGAHDFRNGGTNSYRIWQGTIDPQRNAVENAAPIQFVEPPTASSWDGQMQAYPCVAAAGDDLIMLYNGNGFGRAGFGYARLPGGAARAG